MGGLPLLKAAGLQTAHNPFSGVTPGAMLVAKNVVVFSNGVLQPRRGHDYLYSNSLESESGTFYGSSLVVQSGASTVSYDSGSAITDYSGTFEPVDDSLLRMKFVEARENLYFNTASGVKVVSSASGTPRAAGLPAPRYKTTPLAVLSGDLPADNQIAIRATYIFTDDNGNIIESPPSERVVLTHPAGSPDDASLSIYLLDPASDTPLPSGSRVRIYATEPSGADDADPGDEMSLIYETAFSLAGSPDYGTLHVIGTRALGTVVPLYTNVRNGEGILQANTPPPQCKDLTNFGGKTWYVNTTSKHRLFVDLLGTGSPSGLQSGDTVTIAGVTYTAGTTFTVSTGGTAAENIEATARALVAAVNSPANGSTVSGYYISASSSTPGSMVFEANVVGEDAFTFASSRTATWNPVGTLTSDNNRLPHGAFYSKSDQPEAVPLTNYVLIGSKNKETLRAIPLREKLYVFKEDGIFTVAGQEPFTVDCLDATTRLVSPDSAQVLNNQIIAFTNQGVVAVSDAGVQLLSRPIEDQLLPYLNETMRSLVKRRVFGVAHETDRTYELWVPGAPEDSTQCQKAFVWNTLTASWTTWEATDQYRWGTVSSTDVRHYGGSEGLYYERRDFASTDLADTSSGSAADSHEADDDGNCISVTLDVEPQVGDVVSVISTVGEVEDYSLVSSVEVDGNFWVASFDVPLAASAYQAGSCQWFVHRAFECEVQWAPVAFDRPGSEKRFQYGTFHFGLPSTFTTAYATYETETSGFSSTEEVTITGRGWGTGAWGTSYFGDSTKNLNLRHVIPLEQQRAAMVYPGFRIREAFSQWKLHGLTLDAEETSERTGR